MSDFPLTPEEVQGLKRLLYEHDRRESLDNYASDDFFDALFDRPHMVAALATLAPKKGEPWTEERMVLWLEIVEKTARLVYGLSSEWGEILGVESPPVRVKADAAADEVERKATSARALELLADGPLRLKDLVERLGIPQGSGSSLVDGLEGKGLVKSEWAENGARTVHLVTEDSDDPDLEAAKVALPDRTAPLPHKFMGDRIVDALEEAKQPLTRHQLYDALGQAQGVAAAVAKLVREKTVVVVDTDLWSLPKFVAEPKTNGSESCRAKDCILAATPGNPLGLCDRHIEMKARLEDSVIS